MSNQTKLQTAREAVGAKENEYRKLLETTEKMTPEIRSQMDEMKAEIENLKADVTRYEELVALDARAAVGARQDNRSERDEVSKNFRMIDVIMAGQGDNTKDFLREMHEEGKAEMQRAGLGVGGGVVLPTRVLRSQTEKRATQVVGTNNVGGYLVETSVDSGVIEYLGNKLVLTQMGVQTFDNMVGNFNLPTGTTGLTTAWETEVATSDETNETFGVVSYTPNRLAGFTNISKQLIRQGNATISAYLDKEIRKAFARAWQAAALHGNGASIDGIAGTAGIGSVAGGTNGAAPTWANIVNLWKEVAIDNADLDSMYYLTNAAVIGKLGQTPKQSSGVEGNFIVNDTKAPLNGLPLMVTNSVSSTLTKGTSSGICSAIFCGNFADLGLASWGGIEVFFDPYTGAKTGYDVMHVNGYVDANVHRAVSFAAMLDALTT